MNDFTSYIEHRKEVRHEKNLYAVGALGCLFIGIAIFFAVLDGKFKQKNKYWICLLVLFFVFAFVAPAIAMPW